MGRGRSETVLVVELRGEGAPPRRGADEVAVEEPLEIRLDDHLVGTTLRTPGHDFELAVGFLHGEGLLAGAPVRDVRYCATGSAVDTGFNVVTVGTGGDAAAPTPRLTPMTASCGLCGSTTLADLQGRLAPLEGLAALALDVLAGVPERVRAEQPLFERTGGVHAAAAVDARGEPVVVREDVGRHNAVDKVVGRLLLDGRLPASSLALFVSGRAGFELVQKAWAAGFAAMVAVGAPSALAVRAARAAGLPLAGFAREGRLNVYAPSPA
ncbi:MAG: formate dehydrogenase accessory sulfurtransferase FdhD [Acidimicrobiales bacterium]|nr:formate dehydrogenase accessory sulfurtransferase FdhD [Acidimicrobiales bacterium]